MESSSAAIAAIAPEDDEQKPPAWNSAGEKESRPPSHLNPETTKPTGNPSGIPDGGLVAWVQCAGSFFLFFNGFGMINTFGK